MSSGKEKRTFFFIIGKNAELKLRGGDVSTAVVFCYARTRKP
jgi:hypothetical protein